MQLLILPLAAARVPDLQCWRAARAEILVIIASLIGRSAPVLYAARSLETRTQRPLQVLAKGNQISFLLICSSTVIHKPT